MRRARQAVSPSIRRSNSLKNITHPTMSASISVSAANNQVSSHVDTNTLQATLSARLNIAASLLNQDDDAEMDDNVTSASSALTVPSSSSLHNNDLAMLQQPSSQIPSTLRISAETRGETIVDFSDTLVDANIKILRMRQQLEDNLMQECMSNGSDPFWDTSSRFLPCN